MHSHEKETSLLQNVRCVFCVELRFFLTFQNQSAAHCIKVTLLALGFFLLQDLTPRSEIGVNLSAASVFPYVLHIHLNHLIMYRHLVVPDRKWSHLIILIAV